MVGNRAPPLVSTTTRIGPHGRVLPVLAPAGGIPLTPRRRLDSEMVRRALVASRTEAQDLIAAGRVLVAGTTADKSARMVAPGEPVQILGPPPRYVSRGGLKLEGALE